MLWSVCRGSTTRHLFDYLPSQLPPSPTTHEYLSFPLLLCLADEGSWFPKSLLERQFGDNRPIIRTGRLRHGENRSDAQLIGRVDQHRDIMAQHLGQCLIDLCRGRLGTDFLPEFSPSSFGTSSPRWIACDRALGTPRAGSCSSGTTWTTRHRSCPYFREGRRGSWS